MTMATRSPWKKYIRAVRSCRPLHLEGRITRVSGMVAEGRGLGASVGSLCAIRDDDGLEICAEVVGFKDKTYIVMPLGETRGIKPGSKIHALTTKPTAPVGRSFLGRVADGMGRPLDGRGGIEGETEYALYGNLLNPLGRSIIQEPLDVGIRAVNAMTTLGKGQRVAVMAGSGVGKSVLMGMMAKNTAADISIIALIGERGREVREFVERCLGKEGLRKSVVIVATSDAPALIKIRAAHLATALAEYFRDRGRDVLLMMDSVTRFAMSLREVGLAAGEPPSAKGYTPSVFAQIPKLLEMAGTVEGKGSITGIYNVLVEGDDMSEPVADTVRSIVDGHLVLSRDLAQTGHYPAVDILASISRVMKDIVSPEHQRLTRKVIQVLAAYREAEDLISIGAYVDGSDPEIDFAKRMIKNIRGFLRQGMDERIPFKDSVDQLRALFKGEACL